MNMTEQDTVKQILRDCRRVAVVGLSPKPHRASYDVSRYMQAHGWRIVPVNPVAAGSKILGEVVYATLTEAAQHEKIDLVNVFRNSEDVPPVAREAIDIGAKALWLQLGIVNDAAAQEAESAGIWVIQDKCLKVEHAIHA